MASAPAGPETNDVERAPLQDTSVPRVVTASGRTPSAMSRVLSLAGPLSARVSTRLPLRQRGPALPPVLTAPSRLTSLMLALALVAGVLWLGQSQVADLGMKSTAASSLHQTSGGGSTVTDGSGGDDGGYALPSAVPTHTAAPTTTAVAATHSAAATRSAKAPSPSASRSPSSSPSPTTSAAASSSPSVLPSSAASASASAVPVPAGTDGAAGLGPVEVPAGADPARGVIKVVDDIAGLPVHPAWLPKRTRAWMATAEGAVGSNGVPLSVDNWWHLHPTVAEQRMEAFSQKAVTATKGLFGTVDMMRSGVNVGNVTSAFGAPPLPACVPLTGGTLRHPVLDNVGFFREYTTSTLVTSGIDTDGYVLSLLSATIDTAQAQAAPQSQVRALLWHRIAVDDGALSGLSFPVAEKQGNYYARFTAYGRGKLCGQRSGFPAEMEPETACDGSQQPPVVKYPYCTKPTSPAAVLSIDCGLSESHIVHGDIAWNLMSMDGGGAVLTHNRNRWVWQQDAAVKEYDEVAIAGTSVYINAPGHFFNEILPRLVHLDSILPVHIPLIWADGPVSEGILQQFQAAGMLTAQRQFIVLPRPSQVRARRLYTYSSEYGTGHTPLLVTVSQRMLASRIHAALWQKYSGPPPTTNNIVILSRGQGKSRSLDNEGELVAALQAAHPGIAIDVFEPTSALPFLDVAARVYSARLIIGPHGANLNNMMGARPGATLVEIGFLPGGGMNLPADYFCFARNLGLQYWMSPAERGTYESTTYAHIQDVLDIAAAALLGPAPPQIPSPL